MMMGRLRRKLALAYALMAGVVLTLAALVLLHTSEVQLYRAADSAFSSGTDAIVFKLQNDRALTDTWLAQSEASNAQVIHIEDGGVPLYFRGAWTPSTPRDQLIAAALLGAEQRGLALALSSLNPSGISFEMDGEAGERYLASVTLIPVGRAVAPIKVAVIRDMTQVDRQIAVQRLAAALTVLAGLATLSLLGFIYSGQAVKPAEESYRRQVEFTAIASHELKAPLSVITASSDALQTYPVDDTQRMLLTNLTQVSGQMAHLVDDLLLLARSDVHSWQLRQEAVDVDTLLIECYEQYLPVAAAKGIALSAELPEEPLNQVSGDAERLRQVLCALLNNAMEYTPEGGSVRLEGEARPKGVRLAVADSGPGIPDGEKARVFERFYRADAMHTDRAHYGLGLSVAHELIRLHRGNIHVEDAKPHGARFVIELKR